MKQGEINHWVAVVGFAALAAIVVIQGVALSSMVGGSPSTTQVERSQPIANLLVRRISDKR
jgi:hypothetical protein